MTMRDFANHVIALANENSDGITNLELQKVMYFAIGYYIRENGIDSFVKNLYDEPFEAWPYGPVIRSVYTKFKLNGGEKININTEYLSELTPLDKYIMPYLEVPIWTLVKKSHEHKIWKDNKSKIMRRENVEYQLEDIKDAFINN